jgi:hypothetical protein
LILLTGTIKRINELITIKTVRPVAAKTATNIGKLTPSINKYHHCDLHEQGKDNVKYGGNFSPFGQFFVSIVNFSRSSFMMTISALSTDVSQPIPPHRNANVTSFN